MKILFTGGGSGGHFYPVIAIAEEIRRIGREERLIPAELFYMAPEPYDARLLFDNEITYLQVKTGKLRRYFSLKNFSDLLWTAAATAKASAAIFRIFPDVIVGKGGFGSFPALFAARLFNIPVLIHESDSVPGRVNRWAGRFAKRIAVSFAEAAEFFPKERTAWTGNPIRRELLGPPPAGARAALSLEEESAVVFVTGGSQGSLALNNALTAILPELLKKAEVIHQTGTAHIADVRARTGVLLENDSRRSRYHPIGYADSQTLARIGTVADLVVSRAGSALFEIAAFGKASILVPISDSNGDHQRQNAYAYAKSGAAIVIEEENLTPAIFRDQIEHVLSNNALRAHMAERAREFAKRDAAQVIAREIISIALKHEG